MIRMSAIIAPGTFPCSTAILQGSFEEVFQKAAAAGYDCVQLTVKSPDDYDIRELKDLMRRFNLGISAMATGRIYTADGFSMGSDDEKLRAASVRVLTALADDAALLGHEYPDGGTVRPAIVVGAVRGVYSDAAAPEIYYKQFDRSIRELTAYCEKLGVPVILEASDHTETEAFIDPAKTLDYVRSVGSPVLHAYLDTMHLFNEGLDPAGTIMKYGSDVFSIDISGEGRCAPMDSVMDFAAICRAINRSGFSGNLTFEMPPEPPADSYLRSLEFIQKLIRSDALSRS
ncbi:MAG: sugar phosphate isomerase/epimerase [Lachnospiraceae bacterium]|nr:sugar phosphate isomerase/epimerase [Lachnospiraceae bacterium]